MARMVLEFARNPSNIKLLDDICLSMISNGIIPGILGDPPEDCVCVKIGVYNVPSIIDEQLSGDNIYDGLCMIESEQKACPSYDKFAKTDALCLRLFSVCQLPDNKQNSYLVNLRILNWDHDTVINELAMNSNANIAERISDLYELDTQMYKNLCKYLMFVENIDFLPISPYASYLHLIVVAKKMESRYPILCSYFK